MHYFENCLPIKVKSFDALNQALVELYRLAHGQPYKQVTASLNRLPATVHNQIQAIYEKLEMCNVAGLVEPNFDLSKNSSIPHHPPTPRPAP